MGDAIMLCLIENEIIKIIYHKRNIILFAILLLLTSGLAIEMKIENNTYSINWREMILEEIQQLEQQKASLSEDDVEYIDYINEKININKNYLSNNINPYDKNNWLFMKDSLPIVLFPILILLIISSEIITTEFTEGTISTFLLQPFDRAYLLSSKIITILVLNILLFFFFFFFSWLIGSIIFGFQTTPIKITNDAKYFVYSSYVNLFLQSISLTSICFMLSVFIRNSILSIIMSLAMLSLFKLNTISNSLSQAFNYITVFHNVLITISIVAICLFLSVMKIRKEDF